MIGIEENPYAVEDARENAKDNKIPNVRYLQGKVEDKISSLSGIPDLVVTDPPRAGMEPEVVQRISQVNTKKRNHYVSCNPATLARDLKALDCERGIGRRGYVLK